MPVILLRVCSSSNYSLAYTGFTECEGMLPGKLVTFSVKTGIGIRGLCVVYQGNIVTNTSTAVTLTGSQYVDVTQLCT